MGGSLLRLSRKGCATAVDHALKNQGDTDRDLLTGKETVLGRTTTAMAAAPRTALYLRVSTPDQKPDLQEDGLAAYADRAGLAVVGVYCDHAVSGRKMGRPQLNALMKSARNREIECVLVWKFDRFARSVRHLLTALEEFDHLGVRFISVQDQIDTESPMGRAMFTIIGTMAELESSLISERVSAGMAAARARGKHVGRPPNPPAVVQEVQHLAAMTHLSIRAIHDAIDRKIGRGRVGEIARQVRSAAKTGNDAPRRPNQ